MSIRKLLSLALLSITLTMVFGYSWLMEANLESALELASELRLNRTADAWIKSEDGLSSPDLSSATSQPADQPTDIHLLPVDGTPVVYTQKEALPVAVLEQLPDVLKDGQFSKIETEELGVLNVGYLHHLFRTLPDGESLHVVQRYVLADHEIEQLIKYDALFDKRLLFSAITFFLITVSIVLLFGRRVAKATTQLLHWCEGLTIDSLPDKTPKLPFIEMQRIAEGTLSTVQREREAIEHRHRFLRFASHELRTPLAIASANTELLARHGVDVEGMEALTRLQGSLSNMNSITDALLWLGRGETPLPDAEPVDLLGLVNTIIAENSAQAVANNVTVDVVEAWHEYTVQPRVLLVILCSNLIGNAIRYTRDGRVEIRLGAGTLEIENRGKQLGNKVGSGGHGLGLQLVAWVVERGGWDWDEVGNEMFHRHCVRFSSAKN